MRAISSFYLTGLVLLSGCYANGLLQPSRLALDPTITPAPQIPVELIRRQNGDRFVGWISDDGEVSSRTCDIGGTLYQSGDFWRCCATTIASCNVPVGCISGSLIYTFTEGSITRATYDCTEIYSDPEDASYTLCNTGYLFENTLDSDPRMNVYCGVSAKNWSYYRMKPAVSTTESPSTEPSASPPSAFATSTSTTTVFPSKVAEPETEPNKSKAWIAGAVVGPLVGLALLGAGIFFCLRRRKKKAANLPPTAPAGGTSPSYAAVPNLASHQPYPMEQQHNQAGFVPYGAGAGTTSQEQKHQSFYAPVAQSPHSHGSVSPHPPPSPYQQPRHYSQQYPQQYQQPAISHMDAPQIYSPPPQHGEVPYQPEATKHHMLQHQFSSELDATPHQPQVPR